jgi:aminoglycoside phosphotransferase (APT) family kinase protein
MTAVAPADFLEPRLDALTRSLSLGGVVPGSLARLTGGASYETWAFTVTGGEAPLPLILRRMPADALPASEQVGPETEAQLFIAARENGVSEPLIHHVLTPADAIGRGFIAERVPGETLARRILRDPQYAEARQGLAWQCGGTLARIHAIALSRLPMLETQFAAQRIAALEADYRGLAVARPVFELALRWLHDHMPEQPGKPVLVHGDFRNGNLIIG